MPSLTHTRPERTDTRSLSQGKTCILPLSQAPQDRGEALWVENWGRGFLEENVFASINIALGCVTELPVLAFCAVTNKPLSNESLL